MDSGEGAKRSEAALEFPTSRILRPLWYGKGLPASAGGWSSFPGMMHDGSDEARGTSRSQSSTSATLTIELQELPCLIAQEPDFPKSLLTT